jgi:hypothetical protein
MALLDVVDSYFLQVQAQMQLIDPSQMFGSVIQARDWPMTPPLEGALYLLFVNAVALGGSESQNYYELLCQWNWLLIGSDIQGNQVTANRGDRYRKSMKIQDNLRQANYPSFCAKKNYTVNPGTGALLGSYVIQNGVPNDVPWESLHWSKLTFMPRQDNPKSGFVYGAASLRIYCWDDVLEAVA